MLSIFFQAAPFFFGMILLEHVVLKLQGKKGIRINDGLMSIGNGFIMIMREYVVFITCCIYFLESCN